ncbi:hypothetical protein BDV19DRAFT_384658 [Aspergillus venezuelensis]
MEFKNEKPVVGAKLASHVAMALADAKVANFLWGFQAVSFAGAMLGFREVEDSNCVEFHADRFQHSEEMGWLLARNRHHTVAGAHFHQSPFIVSLIRQSSVSWWLELKPSPPSHNDPHFTLSNDPRLPPRMQECGPCGPWVKPGLHAIKILKPNILIEAVLILLARDWHHSDDRRDQWVYYKNALTERSAWPNGDPRFKQDISARPGFQLAWGYLNWRKPEGWNVYLGFFQLREQLKEARVIAVDLPKVDIAEYRGGKEFMESGEGA